MKDTQTVTKDQISEVFVDCVKESAAKTFTAICGDQPAFKGKDEDGMVREGIVGIISLVGDIAWTLMVGLPKDTATTLALNFAGFEIAFDSEEIGDFAGEIANTVGGDLQNRLHNLDVRAELSVPTVAKGSNLRLMLPGHLPSICLHFASSNGEFWIKLATLNKDGSKSSSLTGGG
jgi:CheY-specific phosphatase CheX